MKDSTRPILLTHNILYKMGWSFVWFLLLFIAIIITTIDTYEYMMYPTWGVLVVYTFIYFYISGLLCFAYTDRETMYDEL